ncbi:uncharacterized protein PAN0_009d3662 [Moesziomyces antarcticus]|uniref:Uncharacterized protein n=1 Tax=Pseudozyma antarctica TaxID=84753 RepID=A0A081CFJ9_PSEA2|nr:uncharacterized protein PAN0_009d3662 [Moesziomyces antarcticus]GAK65445.1 hypothetical protein PAN0_009d3662 [Moesziomyces antarcticus]
MIFPPRHFGFTAEPQVRLRPGCRSCQPERGDAFRARSRAASTPKFHFQSPPPSKSHKVGARATKLAGPYFRGHTLQLRPAPNPEFEALKSARINLLRPRNKLANEAPVRGYWYYAGPGSPVGKYGSSADRDHPTTEPAGEPSSNHPAAFARWICVLGALRLTRIGRIGFRVHAQNTYLHVSADWLRLPSIQALPASQIHSVCHVHLGARQTGARSTASRHEQCTSLPRANALIDTMGLSPYSSYSLLNTVTPACAFGIGP